MQKNKWIKKKVYLDLFLQNNENNKLHLDIKYELENLLGGSQ